MGSRIFIFVFSLCTLISSAQWKSFYPEKNNKKEQNKVNDKKAYDFDTYFFTSLKYKALEDYKEAIKYLYKCQNIDPQNATVYYELCINYMKLDFYDLAIESIMQAISIDENNKWYLIKYSELLFANQDYLGAISGYKKLLKLDPKNVEIYFTLADIYIYNNDLTGAINTYNDLESIIGFEKKISIQKYKLYLQLNKKELAIKELESALSIYANDLEVMEYLAELYLLNSEKEKAFELFKLIGKLFPENGKTHLTLADYYRQQGQNERSFNELKLAFASSKLAVETKLRILISYYELVTINDTMSQQASDLAEIVIKTHPEEKKINAIYGDILYAQKDYENAKAQYLLFLKNDKSERQVWIQVLFIQAEENNYKELLETSEEAMIYFPTEPLFYYFNGLSKRTLKKYEEAASSLRQGVEFVIENPSLLLEFYSSLGDVYNSIGEYNLSDAYFNKALAIDSSNAIVLNNYAYYLSLRNQNLDLALKMSSKSNDLTKNNGTYQDTYAWILYQMGQYEKAKEWMLKALSNGGDSSAVVVEHYGDVLYMLGKKEQALNEWIRAKKIGEGTKFLEKKINDKKLYE